MLDKTLYENNTNEMVSVDALNTVYKKLSYAKKEIVTITEFTELINQFEKTEKILSNAVVGNK